MDVVSITNGLNACGETSSVVTQCCNTSCLSSYMEETDGILTYIDDEVQLFCLHYVFFTGKIGEFPLKFCNGMPYGNCRTAFPVRFMGCKHEG